MSNPYSIYPSGSYCTTDGDVTVEFLHDASKPEQTKTIIYHVDDQGVTKILTPREEPYIFNGKEYRITKDSTIADVMPEVHSIQVAKYKYQQKHGPTENPHRVHLVGMSPNNL